MWTTQYSVDTDVAPAALWAALRDLHTGTALSAAGDTFEIHGPFAVGTALSVTPHGQDTFRSTIVELVDEQVYADRTEVDGLVLLFRHTLDALPGGGTRVTHRLGIDGPAADQVAPELGPQISADFPAAMDDLVAAARRVGQPA